MTRLLTKIAILSSLFFGCFTFSADVNPNGYLYGKVYLVGGKQFSGIIRWGKEEASWGDLFHSSKGEILYKSYISSEHRREKSIKVLGIRIPTGKWGNQIDRLFVARFGDIQEIRPLNSEEADILMKSGRIYSVEGYSNDVGTDIFIKDESLGKIEIPWKKVQKVVFSNGHLKVGNYPQRIYGKVSTIDGSFEGFIQWDHDECIGDDELNGENEDGTFAIPFKKIQSITKRTRNSVTLDLEDGSHFNLRGTNDVNSDNRGIYVDDTRFGRVDIPWEAFKRVDFTWKQSTGPDYDSYKPAGPIVAKCTPREGTPAEGYIAFDLDEMEGWEFLNGSLDDIEYFIPFNMITKISPTGSFGADITLSNDLLLHLEDRTDVTEKNLGILVLKNPDDAEGTFFSWNNVRSLNLEMKGN